MITFTDKSSDFEAVVNSYDTELKDKVHHVELSYEVCCIEDLIMLLREDVIYTGDLEYSDDYQFNNFYICGSDLIDVCKKYDL